MRAGGFGRILERYGQDVELHFGGKTVALRAIVQPVLERREDWQQALPTPLGTVRGDRFLYFGPAEVALDTLGDGFILCGGVQYEPERCQVIWVGDRVSHWWAVLRVRERLTINN